MDNWDGSVPDGVTPFARAPGALVIGGAWSDEPAATEDKPAPALPDPFAD